MSEYTFSPILSEDSRAVKELDELLQREGIHRDAHLDYTIGLYDDDARLVATGSCFKNTLRCLAVDSAHQGEGLMNRVASELIDFQYRRGNTALFLYTKCDKAAVFADMGFFEVARAENTAVFMENRRDGLKRYIKRLKEESKPPAQEGAVQAAVVINANPFTLGHLHLVETAAASCDLLHIFVVSEDASLVPFEVRWKLVREGTAHLPNIVLHQTGSYIISSATFPSYFLKDDETVVRSHAGIDVAVFLKIAHELGISVRFVGSEPFSRVTGIYNEVMAEELAAQGVKCEIVLRFAVQGRSVSASFVRQCLHDGDIEAIRPLVPETTFRFFNSAEAAPVLQRIRAAANVIHD